MTPLDFLLNQSVEGLILIFWFALLFDIPRYTLGFIALAARHVIKPNRPRLLADPVRVSIVAAGHNEADGIERFVRSLNEQTRQPDEIVIVSDGSTDGMGKILKRLEREGRIDCAVVLDKRSGKVPGSNLAARLSTGDILINVDCDSTLDNDAIEEILKPFSDPSVGAVSGSIRVRNPQRSLVAGLQEIEYLLTITLGKQLLDAFGQVVCVSGAFGAFRREVYDQVGGMAPGPGEDLDLTLLIRRKGWQVRFQPTAVCATDVPESFDAYRRQRLRWERDSVRIRYRRHRAVMNPAHRQFQATELWHQGEFLVFHVLASAVFPFYLLWLFLTYGSFAFVILIAVQMALFLVDLAALLAVSLVPGGRVTWRHVLLMPGFSLFQGYPARLIRLFAYGQEWFLFGSESDEYVPRRVRQALKGVYDDP